MSEAAAAASRPRRIAVEEAFALPAQLDAYRAADPRGDGDLRFWHNILSGAFPEVVSRLLDIGEGRIAMMDALGIDMQVLSLTSPGVQVLDAAAADALARDANDAIAGAMARFPGRFAGLATIAVQDPPAAVREMERAAGLGLTGIVVNSHTGGRYLDEPDFLPVLEAAEALCLPVYIHPRTLPPAAAGPYAYGLESGIWGYAAETGLHAMRLILSGVLDRFPDLRIVLGHMGEGIPYWLYRIDYMHALRARRMPDQPATAPSAIFRRHFHITTSGMNDPDALRFCLAKLGPERILWAVDYPYQEPEEAVRWIDGMALDDGVGIAILAGNAERLFRLSPLLETRS